MLEKLLRRLTRKTWNGTVHKIILDAMKKDTITSVQAHEILGAWNKVCWPEIAAQHRVQADKSGAGSAPEIELSK